MPRAATAFGWWDLVIRRASYKVPFDWRGTGAGGETKSNGMVSYTYHAWLPTEDVRMRRTVRSPKRQRFKNF